ncbi:MAG TPA: tetratricopeptide repeat protein [Sphingomicrobium sp.]
MAQPPDISETFVREVDENLRRDQLRDLSKKYAGWLIAAVVLFLAAAGGFIYWQDYKKKQAEKAVEELAEIYTGIGKGDIASAPKRLDALSDARAKAVRASAEFGRAAVAIEQNDIKLATAKFRALAGDKSLPKPFRDLALIRQTALEFDSLKPEQVIARMAPLTKPGTPWYGSAAEMTAMARIKQGNTAEAGRLFAAIAADQQVPEELRGRALQIASTLGVEAGNALPRPAQ